MPPTALSALVAEAYAEAVIPTIRIRPADARAIAGRIPIGGAAAMPYDPSKVELIPAAAGFDVVVQIAATRCLRTLATWIGGQPLTVHLAPADAVPLLRGCGGAVGALADDPRVASEGIDLQVGLVPTRLRFGAGTALTVTVQSRVAVGYQRHWDFIEPSGRPHSTVTWEERAVVGTAELALAGNYAGSPTSGRDRVAFTADFGTSAPVVSGATNAARCVAAIPAVELTAALYHRTPHRGPLCPDVAIAGRTRRGFPGVTRVEHGVARADGLEALTVGFALSATPAIMPAVGHLISGFDYGVTHSERAIDALLRFAWADVPSSFTFDRTTEYALSDGTRATGRLRSLITLHAPTHAELRAMPSTRGDAIDVRGTGAITRLEILDGTTWRAIENSDARFDWASNLDPRLDGTWSADPAVLALQSMFHQALEPLLRPFSMYRSPPQVQFARLPVAARRTHFVGDLP